MSSDNHTTSYSIYRIVCFATGACYIGLTKNLKQRKYKHLGELRRNTHHNSYLQRAYNKYGEKSFYFDTVESGISASNINEREIYWIAQIGSKHELYNLSAGGGSGDANGKPCSWNGVTYPSIVEAARIIGVKMSTLSLRLCRGYTCDEDLKCGPRKCIWDGVEYRSIAEAAKAAGISRNVFSEYLQAGYTTNTDIPRRQKECEWNGIHYATYLEAANTIGISPSAMARRIKHGRKCDSDLTQTFEWNDVIYPSRLAASRATGIPATTLFMYQSNGSKSDSDLKQKRRK